MCSIALHSIGAVRCVSMSLASSTSRALRRKQWRPFLARGTSSGRGFRAVCLLVRLQEESGFNNKDGCRTSAGCAGSG